MQDLAHFHINDEVVLVMRRAAKCSEFLKIRKSGEPGKELDYLVEYFKERPALLELLKNGTVIEL